MLPKTPKLDVVVGVRMTRFEKEAMVARAERAGKSLSDYLRGAGLHYLAQPQESTKGRRVPTPDPVPGFSVPPRRYLASSDGTGGA